MKTQIVKLALLASATLSLLVLPCVAQPPAPSREKIESLSWEELSQRLGGPSVLSLHLVNAPAQRVAEELSRQSPWPVLLRPNAEYPQTVTADFEKQPYWSVVRQLENKGGFLASINTSEPGVQLWPLGPRPWVPLGPQGPYDFIFRGVQRFPAEDKPGGAGPKLMLDMRMLVDPKIRFVDGIVAYRFVQATDENGRSLLPDQLETTFYDDRHVANQSTAVALFFLKPNQGMGQQIKTLAGDMRTIVATKSETWEVADPLLAADAEKEIQRDQSLDRFVLKQVRQVGDDYFVDLEISHPTAGAPLFYTTATGRQFFFQSEFFGPVRLLDAAGHDIANCDFVTTPSKAVAGVRVTKVTCSFRRSLVDPTPLRVPAKLVVNVPTQWCELVVPFEFHDIKLPG